MNNLFGKYFLQFFGLLLVILAFIYDCLFFFIAYPERNHDIVNIITGVINANMITGVVMFFYGSSKGSKDAADHIREKENKAP